MATHNVQLSFSCPLDIAEQLDEHLHDTKRYRGRSEFIREAVQEKVQREHRTYVLAGKEAALLRDIYWMTHKTDPSDDDLLDWISRKLEFPPGLEPTAQPTNEHVGPTAQSLGSANS